ncbi:23S rRNA (guanosine(2251)-2'-O)-methyltransferase RlmB [Enterobacteriaceae endosymbiont of Neohaemonia nigricornis]|uniref:23S rRNA (guanosine(2251)-2'-O)-methyltransferase RlmB n=1 Tax=Enterobacteriaceae endosymbiont of Neohaemonia nigricornis TaxID=2675792 RepID=UPI00144A0407|nr:23S rRNA (guanosine(2251)-2'-O)-methyltransferase RlmB [Enterobacteriaceae endosymbiont of Neohaemonia nigricornis]QJC30368.1 23S rRNA (guanosine(2251)-2'-O)-methyltransferase RlmB [Enterobacteriaceae endosymbiont of Neohaemonia nigricornis]
MEDIIFGIHPIISLLKNNPKICKKLFILKNKKKSKIIQQLFCYIKKYNICIQQVDKKWLDKQTHNRVHQGLLAYIIHKKHYQQNDIMYLLNKLKNPFILILDNITDQHNIGACIRSAVAANINIIIIPKHFTAKINAVARKTSCGTTELVPIIFVKNIIQILILFKKHNINIIGTDSTSNNLIYNYHFTYPLCLIIGSEHKGIRPLIKKKCDIICSIPTFNNVESLNVSVATGIILFEIIRQNNIK